MVGDTRTDGSVTFTMHSSLAYGINVTGVGIDPFYTEVQPSDDEYTIWLRTSASNVSWIAVSPNATLTVYQPNISYITLGASYYDVYGLTNSIQFNLTCQNNNTVVYSTSVDPGIGRVLLNTTIANKRGERYILEYNATRVDGIIISSLPVSMSGPYRLVSLGLETVVPDQATMYYNYLACGILFVFGIVSSGRTTRFFAILIPIMAALMVWFEWLRSPDPTQTWGIITLCMIMAAAYYMKDTLREKYGSGGSGSMIMNIMVFMILIQTVIGVINMTAIWGNNTMTTPDKTYQYQNIDLGAEVTKTSSSGGLLQDLVGSASILGNMAIGALKIILQLLLSVGAFGFILAAAYPWMVTMPDGGTNTMGIAMLGLLQVGIWLIYTKFVFDIFYKPPIGVSDF